ncbi:MAG: alpha amylase C-terminal domain-containing protein [Planctomycetes bacterium]|nr:alpha amylase C-terminal domain-containing protein [Planctomycetota bacterium]
MTQPIAPSPHPGMGSILHPDGCSFRVFAPHATGVQVRSDRFDGGWETPIELAREGTVGEGREYWSVFVPGIGAGARYKYVIAPQGSWRTDPYAGDVDDDANAITLALQRSWAEFHQPALDELVIYELHVGSFVWRGEGRQGTFETAMSRLGYLRDLGINAVQLLPSQEFPGDRSQGYNPSLLYAPETAYGTPEQFAALIDACHVHGIAVLLDVVYNHLGPNSLLWRYDGWYEGLYGGLYFYNDERAETPWGRTERPDYGRPAVRNYLADNARYWMHAYRIDGVRVDATAYIRNRQGSDHAPWDSIADGWDLLRRINAQVRHEQPWKITIAEDLQGNDAMTQPLQEGGVGFTAQWDDTFVHSLRAAATASRDESRDVARIGEALRRGGDALRRVIYVENHDTAQRERLGEAADRSGGESLHAHRMSALAAGVLLATPGIPLLFQGQEFLSRGAWKDGRMLDWDKAIRHGRLVDFHRNMIRLRRDLSGVTAGLRGSACYVLEARNDTNVLAFLRWDRGGARDHTLVVAHFANRVRDAYRIGVPRGGPWRIRLNAAGEHYDMPSEPWVSDVLAEALPWQGMPWSIQLPLPPYAFLVLSQDE